MNKAKITILFTIFILGTFISCNEMDTENTVKEQNTNISIQKSSNLELKEVFAKALAKVLNENREARELIKNEALKKIDYDYDVLYLMVKDTQFSNGVTFEESLLEYIDYEALSQIKQEIPTLTIFVPALPENSFSAEIWNTDNEIPVVAIRTNEMAYIPVYDKTGTESKILFSQIPGFPVIVIKENERIVASKSSSSLRSSSGQNLELSFIDEVFDNTHPKLRAERDATRTGTSSITNGLPNNLYKIGTAYQVYEGTSGWQRDYIYYNITPSNLKGPFHYNFKEHIVGFEMVGDANYALKKISDQSGDPAILPSSSSSDRASFWTDGEFEFKAKYYVGNKNGLENEHYTFFRVSPYNLFFISTAKIISNGKTRYEVGRLDNMRVFLSVPLFSWNLEMYSGSLKISIEEVDSNETFENTTSGTGEFASNFEYNVSYGEQVKVGMKYGESQKETRTVAYKSTISRVNDDLGEVIINFGDPVITPPPVLRGTYPHLSESDLNSSYYTGWYRIYIAPVRTYGTDDSY